MSTGLPKLPELPKLPLFGVDDDGVYHAPNQETWTAMLKEDARLRAQVTELQGRGTELLDEGRMWKLRFKAAHTLLRAVLLEDPFKRFLNRIYPEDEMSRSTALDGVAEIAARVDLLEKDAWTKAGGLAREFVRESAVFADEAERENGVEEKALDFILGWRKKFAALGD